MLLIFPDIFGCCNPQVNNHVQITGYDLTNPDKILILPAILHEISGLTEIDSTSFACIQDENGILFIYDVINNRIRHQYIFHSDGDYEGITRVADIFYVLRSDGVLFEISDYQTGKAKVISYYTGIPAQDNEALCYDHKNGRLLIACKGKIDKSRIEKDRRLIYGFDLESKKSTAQPVIILDLSLIRQFAVSNKVGLTGKIRKQAGITGPDIQLKISDLAYSSADRKIICAFGCRLSFIYI